MISSKVNCLGDVGGIFFQEFVWLGCREKLMDAEEAVSAFADLSEGPGLFLGKNLKSSFLSWSLN